MTNLCGNCKHWHEFPQQTCRIKQGVCDKVPKGTTFTVEDIIDEYEGSMTYKYDGWSFEDECYDDVFKCFEVKE